jgi:hypothetical protein
MVGGGGIEITSARNPGKKRSIRSDVTVHSIRCCSSRRCSAEGGTSRPVAFMTKTTFLRDSGTASYYAISVMTE